MRKLLIATHNRGKFKEMKPLLVGLPFEVLCLEDVPGFGSDWEADESAMTLEGNAIIKAMTAGHKSGLLTLAEDAGLEVDALDGRPGVRSARYVAGSDEDRYRKILEEMKDIPDDQRGAQFVAVVAIYDPRTEKVRTCRGVYQGMIVREPRGTNGFGYDPIFFNTELNKTNAEMTVKEKNSLSHRGKALALARELLLSYT